MLITYFVLCLYCNFCLKVNVRGFLETLCTLGRYKKRTTAFSSGHTMHSFM